MSITAEQLLEKAQRVLESRGKRVLEVGQAVEAETVASRERGEADAANLSEDQEIAEFKQLATDYTKEQDT
jgi:hypothetical protein